MKIATLFTPGAYGTFISWCIYSFSELNLSDQIFSPIDVGGSAHKFRYAEGKHIVSPTHKPLDSTYKNYILVKCDKDKIINYIDNQLQKQSLNDVTSFIESFFPDYNNKLSNSWNGISNWELRELLSFFLEDMITSTKNQIDSFHTEVNVNKCYTLYPEQFILDAAVELEKILIFFNLKKHSRFDLLESHVLGYLNRQQNFHKSDQLDKFIEFTINNLDYQLNNLTLFDESYIQGKLRNQGYEIKCYNLNQFPTSSTELFKLLV